MKRSIAGLTLALVATIASARSGEAWRQYGPDRAGGLFFNITRDYTIDNHGQGLAVDTRGRLLVLADWRSDLLNRDCALTRHLPLARHLDMDFTGPDGLEGTRRIAIDTRVRRGDFVQAGDVIGQVGTTGASSGDHLHFSVHRHRNLSWRRSFEFNFDQWDRDASVSTFDPWGWQAPGGADPWAWRFRTHGNEPLWNNAGSFSTNLWKSGEAPTLD